ncbi:MAG TPA: hypothetical protein VL856_00680 [Acidimicrobiia bacterium]|nr:hypothetical protein [Acidimicrobiia bacterium]
MQFSTGRLARARAAAAIVIAVAALAACSSSSGSDKTPATTAPGRATTTALPAVTLTNDPLGARTAIAPADLGRAFTDRKPAAGWTRVRSPSCSVTSGSPLTKADHAYSGAILQDPKGRFFVYSRSFVFKSAVFAERYSQVRATARFKACAQREDQAAERTRNNKARVQATTTTFTDPTFHITSFYREIAKRPDRNGKLVNVGTYDRYTYQRGRVVVVLAIDIRAATKARIRSLNSEVTAAYDAAVRALEARVPSS